MPTPPDRPVRIAVDIGGTFTDLQILDGRDGRVVPLKVPTTPEDPSLGLMQGIHAAAGRYGFALADVGYLLHGTTIATNAVLERKLPAGALVTTAGFEDVLEIGRHNRRDIYTVFPRPPAVLVPRDRRIGLAERMTARGVAERVPDDAALDDVVARLDRLDVETVAVSLINAYASPAHERMLADRIRARLPRLTVSCSAEVSPEIREYERTSTTVLNALLQPVVRGYLERLELRMAAERFSPCLLIVQSNGGVCSPATAAREPVRLLLSGPSGGAKAALGLAGRLGAANAVGIDMGGTSFDVSVIREGRLEIVNQCELDRLPVRVPMIEIRTIGAGGGSIARVLTGGQVAVGPDSAGARPGPVCYGRGGREPTVTDANLVLGRLDPAYFLGGAMALDLAGAREAIRERIAEPLGVDADAAAAGILRLTDTRLAAAIRVSLFEKGLDPRDFTLVSFGGAGSVHACAVADELAIGRIVFPVDASTFSARGILDADIEHAFARSSVRGLDMAALPWLRAAADAMRGEAGERLAADGIDAADQVLRLSVDLRYRGQAFELNVPWLDAAIDSDGLEAVARRFHEEHERRFSYANPADPVELVTLRIEASGRLVRPAAADAEPASAGGPSGIRRVYVADRWEEVPVWRREAIGGATAVAGPAILEEEFTTVLVGPGWTLRLGPAGHLIAVREGACP
jgi:N-methylhydantoinase A/oxoprolinase/acetone carboxylase beta subunit